MLGCCPRGWFANICFRVLLGAEIFLILHLLLQNFLVINILLGWRDQAQNVVAFIDVDQTKLLEINEPLFVKVQQFENVFVVIEAHGDPAKLKSLDEFFKLNLSIEVDIKVSESYSIVFIFLFKPLMNLS
jgi:hypothetical protein